MPDKSRKKQQTCALDYKLNNSHKLKVFLPIRKDPCRFPSRHYRGI